MIDGERPPERGVVPGVAIFPAILAPAAVHLARLAPGRFLLPILATLAVYPVMAALILRGRRVAAAVATLLWAASLSLTIIAATRNDPETMARIVLNGAEYRDELFAFIRTGAGRESDPARFVPQHILHFAAFGVLAAGTGGLLGIALGAVLVGYMSFYVGALAAAGSAPLTAYCLGWSPWAIVRVVGYVIAGVALSEPLLSVARRRRGLSVPALAYRRWLLVAGALLVVDPLLKAALAPTWAILLRPCLSP
jgi:hypothetical protein